MPKTSQMVFAVVGIFAVLYGAFDVTTRIAGLVRMGADPVEAAQSTGTNAYSLIPLVATTTPITPAHIKIPAIGVDATVESVAEKTDGSMATPKVFSNVGWYSLGSRPGEAGNAVIAGHVNNALTKAGVFEHLSDLTMGDYISVSDASGKTLLYVVREVDTYPADQAPASSIFATGGTSSQLVLITCDGTWDASAHSYTNRLVVYARLAAR